MKLKDFIFETRKYDRPDFNGYRGEVNVSINTKNTNYFIKGVKYVYRMEAIKELKKFLKDNDKEIENSLSKL